MEPISIFITLKNRSHLLKYCLESITRQDYDLSKVEICIADGGSNDNLFNIIDQYSEYFSIKYAVSDRRKSNIKIVTNCPAVDLNVGIRWMPTFDIILKTDPEIILKDNYILSEISDGVSANPYCMYNARTHFLGSDSWYSDYDDIIHNYKNHYMIVDGLPFSRSVFYFCSGFSRSSFIQLGGIEELMVLGVGYDDTLLRDVWHNKYGNWEVEIDGQAIHLYHPSSPTHTPQLFELNKRKYEMLRGYSSSNSKCINLEGELEDCDRGWGNPDILSKIYTIKNGSIKEVMSITDDAIDVDLPF